MTLWLCNCIRRDKAGSINMGQDILHYSHFNLMNYEQTYFLPAVTVGCWLCPSSARQRATWTGNR